MYFGVTGSPSIMPILAAGDRYNSFFYEKKEAISKLSGVV